MGTMRKQKDKATEEVVSFALLIHKRSFTYRTEDFVCLFFVT